MPLSVLSQDWPVIYDGNKYIISRSIVEDYDRGFVLSGYEADSYSFLGPAFIIKTDINASVLWKKDIWQ